MGLMTKLVLLPISPVFGVVWIAEQLERIAAEEMGGDESLRRELIELQVARDEGTIDDAEFEAAARSLLDRMQAASEGTGIGLTP
jgi:hypothetical protein